MLPTTIKFHDNSPYLSEQNNSQIMDDLEAGIPFQPPRQLNKKMKKRKQLDALLKFRSLTSKYNRLSKDIIRSSEDELFLPDQKTTSTKSYKITFEILLINFLFFIDIQHVIVIGGVIFDIYFLFVSFVYL